ncbi:MAG TPA: glycosyltransferase [Streptosporangiaceae bacterium]|nr:glycosyltransferase [Streptosporangiaceae bacterium]
MPLLSVVIPVHGVEAYLDRCLDSVLGDSKTSLEVIAVDDASPDRCGAILAARDDSRLRILTTPAAGGPGPARDLGAKEATGEYVWFVDGDDELAEGALAAVAEALERLRPDVLITDFENLYPDGTTSPSGGARYLRGSAAEPLRGGEAGPLTAHPGLIHLTMTAWSKVFRRDFLGGLGLSFSSAGPAPHEDVPVTALALLTAGRIGVLDRVCYRYRRARRGSYLAAVSAANFNIFASYQQIFNYFSERADLHAPVTPPAVYTAVFERAIWHYTTLLPLVPRRRRREFFRRMSADFRRWRPDGYQFPPGPRGAKFRLVARGAYGAYALIDPVNRLRVRLRERK